MRPLLSTTFPQGFRISKNIGHPTSGSGAKKTFKWYLKSEHANTCTNTWTKRQTDISTYRKHRPRGSEGYTTRIRRLLAGFFWYRCYYPHRSRDVSPVCRIFLTVDMKSCFCHILGFVNDLYLLMNGFFISFLSFCHADLDNFILIL